MDLFRQLEPEKSPSHRTHDSKSSRAAESLHGDDEAPAGGISSHLANHRPSQRRRWRILGVLVLVVGISRFGDSRLGVVRLRELSASRGGGLLTWKRKVDPRDFTGT